MASSSSSFISEPAISSRSWKQHVFLSFRGEDTRNTFVGHLYTALENMGIITYKDDKKLSLGETISPSLIEAIEQSQIAIIIFSKHYANSSWCLNELKHIMKCTKETGLIAVPVFYGVEASDVRKQENKFGEPFAKYESVKNINVASWRDALVEATSNSGQDFKSGEMNESELIKDIVNKISKIICPLTPWVNDKLVGIEARRDTLISKLQIGSDFVFMIGIWGVGGSGKTTLATSVYSNISWKFDGCCCIENIRDETSKNGLVTLQNKIISGVMKQDKVWVRSTEEGKYMIKERFSGKKVLIVLDDVDQRDQLEALAGSIDWFAKESRILITTRNKHLLIAHKVDVQNVILLDNYESTKLLVKCACLYDKLKEDYEEVSKEVVTYASGLPLALTVLGSFLCGRGVNQWKSTLARLKNIPDDDIMGKLRISYDGLKKVEQDLFLDLACFFKGWYKDDAMPILEACGLYPEIGLEVLREKALITFTDYEGFDMHDLVQEMAQHIVRGEHPDNPEKHSRVWKEEDVETICSMDTTTDLDMIEALRYRKVDNPLPHLPSVAANMKNLRLIDWEGGLSCPLLTNSPQEKICCLLLSSSFQKKLWDGYKLLPNLKMMKLRELENLIMLPNFVGLPNLERFELFDCPKLQEIHSSFGALEKLVFLSIAWCENVKIFPGINRLKNLKTLLFQGGSTLFNHETHRTRFWFSLPNLTKLDLKNCKLDDKDIGSSEWELPHLQELDLSENKFSRLDFSRWQLPWLKWLSVEKCFSLVELSNLPSSINVVVATYCESLESFGDTSNCKWLWKVYTNGVEKVDPIHGERLLNSMLQGNAIEDHFIWLVLQYQIPKGFVGRFFKGKTFTQSCYPSAYPHKFTLKLPYDWQSDFYGFLIRLVSRDHPNVDIIMKHEEDKEDSAFEKWQEFDEAPELENRGEPRTYVGYVSFRSLRKTTSLNSSYNIISFSFQREWSSFAAELVPMKNKDNVVQSTKVATNCSELRDGEDGYFTNFTGFIIRQESDCNIRIMWSPYLI